LGVGIEGNVHDVAVFLFAFSTDVVFELADPRVAFFSRRELVGILKLSVVRELRVRG
jgi:hypothetical protein